MYYTDVFVGQTGNIVNLKDALNAVLNGFNSNDLTQLVHGLCLFMGYPSCLCSLKANVDKSLQDISKKLKEDSEAVQSCLSSQLDLNCSNCISENILCKCCVISCIKELPTQSKCKCVKNTSNSCQCSGTNGKCCKDFLSGLEACLSLLNLKTDLAVCNCKAPDCCNNGTCTNSKCNLCKPETSTITGLGLSRPNPVRLAKRLSDMLCGTRDQAGQTCKCGCGSGTKNTSCCCFCHNGCKTGKISVLCSKACPGCSAQHPQTGECGLKDFCKSINTIRVLVGSKEMTCCDGGKNCHCALDSGSKCSSSGCCVEQATSSNDHYQHSVKCMILRVVKFFKDFPLDASSPSKCSKICCELICVGKYCDFLKMFFDKGGQKSCGKCNGGPQKNCKGSTLQSQPSPNNCCNGTDGCKSGDCCLGCQECDAIKFRNALETLKLSSPCGQDLYRTLDAFIQYCREVLGPKANSTVKNAVTVAKKICTPNCKSTGGSCQCPSTSSPCKGCQHILQDPQLKVLLAGGYSSSYSSSASWKSLCSHKSGSGSPCSSCQDSSCPCQGSFPLYACPDNGCCEKCPKRLCAKIFLGMLPCLYYALKYLYDRCKGDWSSHKIINNNSSLHRFLRGMGYEIAKLDGTKKGGEILDSLKTLFTSSNGSEFKDLYEKSKKYFTSFPSRSLSSPGSLSPSTVRSMLLWLYGLRFQKHFSDLVSHSEFLCSPFGNSFNADAFCYYIHTCSFILPVAIISFIEDSSVQSLDSEFSKFFYPSDPSDLFEKFCEYSRKIFVALNFLCIQCKNGPSQAGWQSCWYGQKCAVEPLSSSSPSGCSSSCSGSKTYLCNSKGHSGKCSGSSHSSSSCPHPLMRFLCHSKPNSDSESYPFHLPGITPMGFESSNLSSTARDGLSLYAVLHVFCESGFYPLTRLVQFILCVSQRPPETLLELFAFFVKFKDSGVFTSKFADYVTGEPGFYSGSDLKNALENFIGSGSHSGNSHSADLKSLYDCPGQKGSGTSHPTCGKYLYPLTYNAYNNNIFIKDFLDTYLSIVCHYAPNFKEKLKDFYNEALTKSLKCCLSSSKCEKIVECPCALPFLYSFGFGFRSPKILNGTNKKSCSDFITQLGLVANGDLFTNLLEEIDNFLWSIRFPFFFGFLYVWFFVLSYFFYVILIKLDTVHTGSHLHLPRSFKILPSTLFSDASSKLKDLSYFTL
ncbi:variant erythrocyte surface antigen-1 family protein [Babesia divergens]|uniref:Variant erythrocyte surface antigen-1 family protein n=1 Tax=Babesia divergens TaxID=32595 RepID=A0AAD9LH11_BABDI|nr:variant erythrocyte surface antigen-1 family protein [Babesia divergens]